jgi:hypothetical protein
VRRAALGVLRLAAQLLAARDDIADALLRSLSLLPRLHPNVAWELAEPIAQQARRHLISEVSNTTSHHVGDQTAERLHQRPGGTCLTLALCGCAGAANRARQRHTHPQRASLADPVRPHHHHQVAPAPR